MAWSVDIGAIPPPAPGWDTGWGEEEGSGERGSGKEERDGELHHVLEDEDHQVFVNIYKCEKCGKIFKHNKSMKRHAINTPHCDSRLDIPPSNLANIDQICVTISAAPGQTNYCHVCLSPLQLHREEYSNLFKCCLCNKMLGNRQKLAAHHRTHTREKPFQCNLCEKMFAECSSLRKHLLTHGQRKYKCDSCNKCFIRKDYLCKHIKSNVCLRFIK